MAKEQDDILNEVTEGEYKYGFVSDVGNRDDREGIE